MKKTSLALSLRHLLALAALALGSALAVGCAVDPDEPNPADESVDVDPQIGNCCLQGALECASNGYYVNYAPGGCGLIYTTALARCKSHCNNVNCIDYGFDDICQ